MRVAAAIALCVCRSLLACRDNQAKPVRHAFTGRTPVVILIGTEFPKSLTRLPFG